MFNKMKMKYMRQFYVITSLLHSRLAGRDKNVVIVVRTLVSRGVTATELEVETSVSLVDAETKIQVDTIEVRDESNKERRVSYSEMNKQP